MGEVGPPAPAATEQEVALRRLLHRCEQHVQACTQSEAGGEPPPVPAYLQQNLETLQQQVKELAAAARTDSDGSGAGPRLEDLRTRVQRVAEAAARPATKPPPYLRALKREDYAAASPLAAGAAYGGMSGSSGATFTSSGPGLRQSALHSGPDVVKRNAHLQDELTEELVGLAAGLKHSSLALEKQLKGAAKTLDSTEQLVEDNLANTKEVKGLATEQYKRAAKGGCLKWVLLLAVGVIFSWMVMFIRTFSVKV